MEHYGHRCLRCGSRDELLTVDHVIPLSLGGANSIDNIQPLCEGCNLLKGQGTTEERVGEACEAYLRADTFAAAIQLLEEAEHPVYSREDWQRRVIPVLRAGWERADAESLRIMRELGYEGR